MPRRKKVATPADDVLSVIREAYPANVVSDDVLFDRDSYYEAIQGAVRAALRKIVGTVVLYDRPPEGRSHWEDGADAEEDPPAWAEEASSYDLLFLAPEIEACHFKGEMPADEEDGEEDDATDGTMLPTEGRVGCVVGISTVAPFAAVRFSEIEWTEDGSSTMPDVPHRMFTPEGGPLDLDEHYKEWLEDEGYVPLCLLRSEITRILKEFGIRVLGEEELQAPVPDLEPDRELNPYREEGFATVEEALFYLTFD